ncbi:MAG TPA: hypothetical protein PL033_12240 [Candidatus Brocadiia bacterium]|nr:hypothetical protein [Candidatus Brocadiia bacterium]
MIERPTIFERTHDLIWSALDASANFREAFRDGRCYRWTRGDADSPSLADGGAADVDCPALSIRIGDLPSEWRSDATQEFKVAYPASIWDSARNPFVPVRRYAVVWEALMGRTDSHLGYPEKVNRFQISAPSLRPAPARRYGVVWQLDFSIDVMFVVNARTAGTLFHSPATGA